MTAGDLNKFLEENGLRQWTSMAEAGEKGWLNAVFIDLAGKVYCMQSCGLPPEAITMHDCGVMGRMQGSWHQAGTGGSRVRPIFKRPGDYLAHAARALGPNRVKFTRALFGEADSQTVGSGLAFYRRTRLRFAIMTPDGDLKVMGLPADTIVFDYPRKGKVRYVLVGAMLATMQVHVSLVCKLHSLIKNDLFLVQKGAGFKTVLKAVHELDEDGGEALTALQIAGQLRRMPRVKFVENADRIIVLNAANFQGAVFIDPEDWRPRSLTDFNNAQFSPEDLEAAGVSRLDRYPLEDLKDISDGIRHHEPPYALREPDVPAAIREAAASGRLELFVDSEQVVQTLIDHEERNRSILDALEEHIVELDGRPLFLTGPNATWRDKLQLTDGQIHHALFCTIPRGELLAVLANANWTPESMRSEITVAKYRELDDRLLPEYFERGFNLKEDLELRWGGSIKGDGIYQCWPVMTALGQSLGLPHVGALDPAQMQTLFSHWPQQPGGKERRDYWDRRAVKEREDAGLDYLRGNAKRYKGVGDVYYALSRCLILYVEDHIVFGHTCDDASQVDPVLNRLALFVGRADPLRACWEEVRANYAPAFVELEGLDAGQLRGRFCEMGKEGHASHASYLEAIAARERTRRDVPFQAFILSETACGTRFLAARWSLGADDYEYELVETCTVGSAGSLLCLEHVLEYESFISSWDAKALTDADRAALRLDDVLADASLAEMHVAVGSIMRSSEDEEVEVSAPRLTRLAYRMREAERERAVETAALQGKSRERAACLAKLWQRREAAEARLVKADAALLAAAAARE